MRRRLELRTAQHRDAVLDLGQVGPEQFLNPVTNVRPIGGLFDASGVARKRKSGRVRLAQQEASGCKQDSQFIS